MSVPNGMGKMEYNRVLILSQDLGTQRRIITSFLPLCNIGENGFSMVKNMTN